MFLACDIGNSQIKTGLFSENRLVESVTYKDVEEIVSIYSRRDIKYTGISSVVPLSSERLAALLDQKSISFHLVSVKSHLNLTVDYTTPLTLGTDRICSAEGAYYLNGKMEKDEVIISVDFGTATTINTISYPGNFIGGLIAPGIDMMGTSLHSNTAQLPQVNFSDYEGTIGSSTKSSIASGLINSSLGMIERVMKFLATTYNTQNIKVYLTGGNAEYIVPHIDFKYVYEKNLVLYGIKAIADLNSGA